MAVPTPYLVPAVTFQQARADDLTALMLGVEGHDEAANLARLAAAETVRDEYLRFSDGVYGRARIANDPDPRPSLALDEIIAAQGDVLRVIESETFADVVATHLDLADGERIVSDEDGTRWEWVPAHPRDVEYARSRAQTLRTMVHGLEHARALSIERNGPRRNITLESALRDLPTAISGGVIGNDQTARNTRAEALLALVREDRFFLRHLRSALPEEFHTQIPRIPKPVFSVIDTNGDLQRAFDVQDYRFTENLHSYLLDNAATTGDTPVDILQSHLREELIGAEPADQVQRRSNFSQARLDELQPGQVINIVGVPATTEGLTATPGTYRDMEFVHATSELRDQGRMLLLASQGRYAWVRTTADAAVLTGERGNAYQSVGKITPPKVEQRTFATIGNEHAHFAGYDTYGTHHDEMISVIQLTKFESEFGHEGDSRVAHVLGEKSGAFRIPDIDDDDVAPLTLIKPEGVYPAPNSDLKEQATVTHQVTTVSELAHQPQSPN